MDPERAESHECVQHRTQGVVRKTMSSVAPERYAIRWYPRGRAAGVDARGREAKPISATRQSEIPRDAAAQRWVEETK